MTRHCNAKLITYFKTCLFLPPVYTKVFNIQNDSAVVVHQF